MMGLLERLARQASVPARPLPTFALAAPRCGRCGELIHLLRVAPERWAGPYYHARCTAFPTARATEPPHR